MKRKLLQWSFFILLILGIYGYFRFMEYLQWEQMPNVWEMRDGQLIQIKQDGNWLNITQEGN
jgi:hypothetical protein